MSDGAVFDPQTARWLVQLAKKLEGSQLLNPGQMERIVLKVMPRFQGGGGGSVRMFKTPVGGIPAAAGTTPGSATCTEYPTGMGGSAGSTSTVKNHRTSIIPGEVFILVQSFGADLYCIEGNCPTVISEPSEETAPDDGLEGEFL